MNNTALVFPGQGSQYQGMCKDILNSFDFAKIFFDKASNYFEKDLFNYCINGSSEDLASTDIAQPSIFIHSIILDKILKDNNVKISAVAGHSLGEYSALVSCGALTFDDCLKILKIRCQEMQIANTNNEGGMLAIINEDIKLIEQICNKFSKTVIANINSHNQIIVSGPISELDKSIKLFKNNNIKKIIKLNVSGAFHSPLMEEANLSLKKVINSVNFSDTTVPIYQNVSSIKTFKGKEIKNNLSNQLTGSVLWYQTILNMEKNGINHMIEVGPKKVLSKLIKKITPNIKVESIDNLEDLINYGFKIIK